MAMYRSCCFRASGKPFPLLREINVPFLPTNWEKSFLLIGNLLSRNLTKRCNYSVESLFHFQFAEFGTRIAIERARTKDPSWQAVQPSKA
jgi:hypothetical protein